MPAPPEETLPVLPIRSPDFTRASHYALTRAAGLNYGTEFQRVEYGWVEGTHAFAVFSSVPAASDLSKTNLHPAILDAAFQLIIQLLKNGSELIDGISFVPVKMGKIVFRKTCSTPYSAQATLLKRSPHSVLAEFTIFDAEGKIIAVVKEARFRSVRLYKHAADQPGFFDFSLTPAPHSHPLLTPPQLTTRTDDISFTVLANAMKVVAEQSVQNGLFNRYAEEIEPLLDSLSSSFVIHAFLQLADNSGILSTQTVKNFQENAPQVARYFNHLLNLAEQDQSIIAQSEGWEIAPAEGILPTALWRILMNDYPEYYPLIQAVGRTGMHLPDIITGELSPSKLTSGAASRSAFMRLVLRENGRQLVATMVQNWIKSNLEHLPKGQRLGIFEISSGSPMFAAEICAQLDFNYSDFTFASTSDDAHQESASLRERYPRFNTSLIDVKDIGNTNGGHLSAVPRAPLQLVILQLNFASLSDSLLILSYAKSHLIAGGSLMLIGQHPSRWTDFIFGCQVNNEITRWHTASPEFWQEQLHTIGFLNTQHISLAPDARSGPYILISQAGIQQPGGERIDIPVAKQHNWLILADESGFSAQLATLIAKKLGLRGNQVRICQARGSAHITSLLLDSITQAPTAPVDNIVYLTGLNCATDSAMALLEQQVDRCSGAAALIQACESAQVNATCWFITAHVAMNLLCADLIADHPKSRDSTISLSDSALWGFGRTLMNEASNYSVRLIDLHATDALDCVAESLDRELAQPDQETEIVLSSNGARYAPRLRSQPPPISDQSHSVDDPTLRFAFQIPGQLRNLRWEVHPRKIPDEYEIEVEVCATGLNFRDVMYALGLLSDEAIENGFAGPTLGLEFAGVVLNVGEKGSGFKAGDRVVGFGPSSFSNRVITRTDAISLIPEHVSFAEAATIPSTFLTVYYALHHLAQLQPGEKVLIHGAAGGVGIAAIQIAKWLGAEIYATAGSDEKRDFLRLWGIEHIYDSRSLSFTDEILTETEGKGIDVVLNSLSGEAISSNFRVLKPFGRFIELGKRDFYENTKIGLRPFRNNISYFGVDADQLMQVRPELTRKLFGEVIQLFDEGIFHPLPYTAFEANDIISAFRYMQQAKQIGKIVVTYHQAVHRSHYAVKPAQRKRPLKLNADGTYLVTGGLSGFGLKTAEWLVNRGARHLVLISRQGPISIEAKTGVSSLEKQGAQVHAVACDVTDAAALSILLQHIQKSMPPVKGIVHAAMVVEDGLIRNMDAGQIRRVLAPKVLGALNLHQLTENVKLDYFILFSSATTLFGNPGQGNYVAANASLEALARNRRASGLPATCVRWGAIDDVGFLARNKAVKDALQSRMGGTALQSDVALEMLELMLQNNSSGLGILDMDWRALARFLPTANSAKYSEMAQNDSNTDNDQDLQHLLATLPAEELHEVISSIIKHEVGEILRLSPEKIDNDRSIYELGLDSLMGVELVSALESRLGVRISVMAMSSTPTINKLAERIIVQLHGTDKPEIGEAHVEQFAKNIALQHGVEISAEVGNDRVVSTESVAKLARTVQSDSSTVVEKMIK
jgi:NADPH:quinone reductase-like Zn-dependent oxidoreductase/acyl carrier protein